jgi:hypothetical protein
MAEDQGTARIVGVKDALDSHHRGPMPFDEEADGAVNVVEALSEGQPR